MPAPHDAFAWLMLGFALGVLATCATIQANAFLARVTNVLARWHRRRHARARAAAVTRAVYADAVRRPVSVERADARREHGR